MKVGRNYRECPPCSEPIEILHVSTTPPLVPKSQPGEGQSLHASMAGQGRKRREGGYLPGGAGLERVAGGLWRAGRVEVGLTKEQGRGAAGWA